MDGNTLLSLFFNKTATDCRIGIRHIGLYVTLFQMVSGQGFEIPLIVFSSQVMKAAKICSSATYHKLIRELNDYGYIRYEPSFYKRKGSRIYLQ